LAKDSQDLDKDKERLFSVRFDPPDASVNKGLELLHPIQNSLQLHPGSFSRLDFLFAKNPIQDLARVQVGHIVPQIMEPDASKPGLLQALFEVSLF
jgi:hypothetical protein